MHIFSIFSINAYFQKCLILRINILTHYTENQIDQQILFAYYTSFSELIFFFINSYIEYFVHMKIKFLNNKIKKYYRGQVMMINHRT